MPVRGIVKDVGEKMFELGQTTAQTAKKQAVSGVTSDFKKQIVGEKKKTGDEKADQQTSRDSQPASSQGKQQFSQMLGSLKQMSSQQLAQAKQKDVMSAVEDASQVRADLKAEQIKNEQKRRRYQQIQREIEEYRIKKAKELPKYIAGKPGQAATPEEQAEKMDQLKKEEEVAKKEEKKKSVLSPVKDRLLGTREKGKIIAG